MPARFTRSFLAALFAVAGLSGLAGVGSAQIPGGTIKIGVLSDFSGPFADQVGKGSLVGAQLAAEDFAKEAGALKVEIIFADHQNKPDIGVAIARRWVDDGRCRRDRRPRQFRRRSRRQYAYARKESRDARFRDRDLRSHRKILSADHGPMGSRHLGARKRGRPHDHQNGRFDLVLHQLRLCSRQGSAARRDRGDNQGGRVGPWFGVASARRDRFRLVSFAGASLRRQGDRSRRHRRRRDQRHSPGGGVSDRRT